MHHIETIIIGRVIERLLIVLIGAMCIYFGYRLFDRAHKRQGELEVSGKTGSLKLRDVAPGVYFALFGSVLMVVAVVIQLKTDVVYPSKVSVDSFVPKLQQTDITARINAINVALKQGHISVEEANMQSRKLVMEELSAARSAIVAYTALKTDPQVLEQVNKIFEELANKPGSDSEFVEPPYTPNQQAR